jgi:hypothetical protein
MGWGGGPRMEVMRSCNFSTTRQRPFEWLADWRFTVPKWGEAVTSLRPTTTSEYRWKVNSARKGRHHDSTK